MNAMAQSLSPSPSPKREGGVTPTDSLTPAPDGRKAVTLKQVLQNTSVGGYVIGQAKLNDQDDAEANSNMNLRLVRLYVDGKVLDFAYKLQLQMNGIGKDSKENSPRIVDAWAEWQRFDFLKVKFGQFKRCFTFENPMHPWLIGSGNYSQLALKLAGFSDRVGEHASNGRDMGLQLQGDLLPVGDKHRKLLHYQVGLYNGQGINHSDKNSRKDVIGGLIVKPIDGLQIGWFGWDGNYVANGVTARRTRWAVGATYEGAISARAEYAHSVGRKIGTDSEGNGILTGADRADAWYALVGVPVADKVKVWAKYDVYRDSGTWASTKSLYTLTADWNLHKNFKLQASYTFTHDRQTNASGGDGDYNTLDLQVYFRF